MPTSDANIKKKEYHRKHEVLLNKKNLRNQFKIGRVIAKQNENIEEPCF